MGQFVDLTGRVFNRLIVIERSSIRTNNLIHWKCICECGNTSYVITARLTAGKTKSCGCLKKTHKLTHGKSRTKEYVAWTGMIQRCSNPKTFGYERYGGRGIRVCTEWQNSFEDFLAEVGNAPTSKHTLERIDSEGNYEPGNVKWATRFEQAHNTIQTNSYAAGVTTLPSGRFTAMICVSNKLIHLGSFDSMDEAINVRKQAERLYWEKA